MHSVLRVYNQLISYTWAKHGFQVSGARAGKRENANTAFSRSYREKCIHVHAHPPTQIDLLSHKAQEKSMYDKNLTMMIFIMGQETSLLVCACSSELQHPHTSITCCPLICLPCSISSVFSVTVTMQFSRRVVYLVKQA